MSDLRLPKIIIPKFSIEGYDAGWGMVVQISGASIGYFEGSISGLSGITLALQRGERMAITGDDGSGQSTLIKAILGNESVYKTGDWYVVKKDDMGLPRSTLCYIKSL